MRLNKLVYILTSYLFCTRTIKTNTIGTTTNSTENLSKQTIRKEQTIRREQKLYLVHQKIGFNSQIKDNA